MILLSISPFIFIQCGSGGPYVARSEHKCKPDPPLGARPTNGEYKKNTTPLKPPNNCQQTHAEPERP